MTGRAFFSAISGLRNQQVKLDVIANNIANLNTFGFKSSRVTFADLLSQTMRSASSPTATRGGTNPMQVGLGTKLSSIDTNINQGSIQSTGNITDLAINGEGFFIVSDGVNDYYSRSGNFSLDATGAIVDPNGFRLQGFTQRAADGLEILDSLSPSDITINFGEKLEARATTEVSYRSNLDASSYTFGSAELQTAGSTGLTTAAGIMLPIASHQGGIVAATFAVGNEDTTLTPGNDLVINGQNIDITFPATWTWGDSVDNAEFVAQQINNQSTTVYARATSSGGLIIDSLLGGEADVIIAGIPLYLNDVGLTAGTYEAPEASSALAGTHTIVVTDATAARDTTSTPVIAGTLLANSITMNGVVITYTATPITNTSAQNAAHIAAAINAATGVNVTATANANGTLTLMQQIEGENNEIRIEESGAPSNLALLGLDTIGTFEANTVPPPSGWYVVNNGTNARASNTFAPDDGTLGFSREIEHGPPAGLPSTLEDLSLLILGENPPFPLIPGVVLTADELTAGQAAIITHDAFVHQASVDIFDSLGTAHNLVVNFQHVGENTWDWTAELPDEPNITLLNSTGTMEFGTSGLISSTNPANPITFQPLGATAMQVTPIYNGEGELLKGVTQFASPSTTAADNQDGWTMGILQSFAFDTTGVLRGIFSNGLTRPIARLALGLFANPAGLQRRGDNTFLQSANSGISNARSPGTGGAGVIIPGALEQSNVDAATEFTELIIAQRSYQANSRIITVQSELLQDVINLIR